MYSHDNYVDKHRYWPEAAIKNIEVRICYMISKCQLSSSLLTYCSTLVLLGIVWIPAIGQTSNSSADVASIENQIEKMVEAMKTGNAELYASVYAPDADYINGGSPHIKGSQNIRIEIEELFKRISSLPNFELPINEIRFLGTNVALVDCFVTASRSRASYILEKRGNTWLIAAARILQPEQE